jgi:hypothetical protein
VNSFEQLFGIHVLGQQSRCCVFEITNAASCFVIFSFYTSPPTLAERGQYLACAFKNREAAGSGGDPFIQWRN